MHRKLRTAATAALALLAAGAVAALAPPASAQKGVLGSGADPSSGVVDPDGGLRYTAAVAGGGTVVAKLATDGGRLERSTYVDSRLVVPSVAYDGSASGLSADGRTLVLAQPGVRFPQTRSDFAVFDTRRLKLVERISLPGTFSFDAISPDGRSLYLIEYTSPRDLTQYEVRAYDLARDRLEPDPIIDPEESSEDMYGSPVTRSMSPDGRWAYTLYDGAEYPFIHALDTERGTAVCIDLELLDRIVYGRTGLEPAPDGSTLAVVNRGKELASVDLSSFEVSGPPPAAPEAAAAPTPAQGADDSDDTPWALIAGGVGLLIVAGSLIAIRRRPDRVDEEELERLVDLDRVSRDEDAAPERDPLVR